MILTFGYKLIEIWACDFKLLFKQNNDINIYLKNHPLLRGIKINPREVFYGGRTDNIITYYSVEEGEKIKYLDACSLYPYICKRGKFPV